jgi:two-component system sensor histidine kinase UhpB
MTKMAMTPWRTRQRLVAGDRAPWLLLLVATRVVATAIAIVLLLLDPARPGLAILAGAYGLAGALLTLLSARLRRSPIAWAADFAILLALILASGDWRSPFYLLWLTSLALPAVQLPLSRAPLMAFVAVGAYLVIAFVGGPAPGRIQLLTSETLVIHLVLPVMCVLGLAYATDALRRAQLERNRRERLAIEAERQRIAWELHDSAKQRLHAAHLIISALEGRVDAPLNESVQRAVIELESAAADMDTSLAELRSPLEGRPLHEALAARAAELSSQDSPRVEVTGSAPALSPLVAAHVYRISCEAITNALRHAEATQIDVIVEATDDGVRVNVIDDGVGIPDRQRPRSTGILAMQSRAASIGATLSIRRRTGGGTHVLVDLAPNGGSP